LNEIRHEAANAVLVEIDDGVMHIDLGDRAGSVLELRDPVTLGVRWHEAPLLENGVPNGKTPDGTAANYHRFQQNALRRRATPRPLEGHPSRVARAIEDVYPE
jgi:hypothetical protein